jgi:choline dehydrogenase-like flavoprotein
VVARVTVTPDGTRATGVEFVDALTGRTDGARAKVVFLCASTLESVRILMNSTSTAHPQGIGAASGALGRYVMDHSAGNVYFYLPGIPDEGGPYALLGSDSIMIPRYQNLGGTPEPYLRGFGLWGGIQRLPVPGFLQKHKREAWGFLCARSETLPHRDNRMELDPVLTDAWGIPAAHIVCEWKQEDLALASAGRQAAREIVEAGGGVCTEVTELFYTPLVTATSARCRRSGRCPRQDVRPRGRRRADGGRCEVLGARPWARAWDVPNLYVTDGACWPTSGWQNPTLTEMAVTARSCEHAAQQPRREGSLARAG